jgi:hypothetical protein
MNTITNYITDWGSKYIITTYAKKNDNYLNKEQIYNISDEDSLYNGESDNDYDNYNYEQRCKILEEEKTQYKLKLSEFSKN